METLTCDIAVIGAGILGAATAAELSRRRPEARIVVLEKELKPAAHQTGRNSGVVHSGVYYTPGSLKARLCRAGLEETAAFCAARNIPFERRGKLLVATDEAEASRLEKLSGRAVENGVTAYPLDAAGLRRHEPAVAGIAALRIPATAIVDYVAMTRALLADVEDAGGSVRFGARVTAIAATASGWRLSTSERTVEAGEVVACGGLASDRLAGLAGIDPGVRILPFRGEYYTLPAHRSRIVHHLIYPVPDPALPFLGVHLTPMIDGSITVGPNAILSLSREDYRRFAITPRDAAAALAFPGLWRVLARYPGPTWAELRGSLSRKVYMRAVRKYCPELTLSDLRGYRAGNRAQAVRRDGTLVDDFLIERREGLTLVLNAPSPAATSALPIARHIADGVLGTTPETA